ncbi:MAG TPA: Rossmann-like and DUF2520 domain-containing protein [Terriglobia bacterium]|nr:Rossmann-like and DUF2520 domain-containing protein [Terriglobia bacterium]
MRARRELSITIVGPGRLGQAMGKLLLGAGVPIGFVAGRQLSRAGMATGFIGGGKATTLKDRQLANAGVILITTSDAAVGPVARTLANFRKDWSGQVVLHTCGSQPASILEAFKKRGAAVGSLHPYQTIPNPSAGARNLPGCYWAVEGDRQAVAVARRWVKALGGKSFVIAPDAKARYHLSAFLVCPTAVTLMDCSERLLREAGVPKNLIRPMLGIFVSETVRNFVEFGGRKSLTGPAARGDWATTRKHLAEIRRVCPEALPAYCGLLQMMAKIAGRKIPSDCWDVS